MCEEDARCAARSGGTTWRSRKRAAGKKAECARTGGRHKLELLRRVVHAAAVDSEEISATVARWHGGKDAARLMLGGRHRQDPSDRRDGASPPSVVWRARSEAQNPPEVKTCTALCLTLTASNPWFWFHTRRRRMVTHECQPAVRGLDALFS